MALITIRYPDELNYGIVYHWLDMNCEGKFYPGTDWGNWELNKKNHIVQFELESDAVIFSLRWL